MIMHYFKYWLFKNSFVIKCLSDITLSGYYFGRISDVKCSRQTFEAMTNHFQQWFRHGKVFIVLFVHTQVWKQFIDP